MGRRALAAAVDRVAAERVRERLLASGLLDPELVPRGDVRTGEVWFPLRPRTGESPDDEVMSHVRDVISGHDEDDERVVRFVHEEFDVRPSRARHYRERLSHLPDTVRDVLPVGFDVVGDVAIMKLPEPVQPYREEVAAAVLATHRNLRTVAQDAGVAGALRVRDLEVIGGGPRLDTVHREHGLEVEVPLAHAYFSPRLATERQRLASRVRPGEHVLDLFAGVGAFVCLLLRDRAPATVLAVDLNPHAIEALRANLRRNRLDRSEGAEVVELRHADARALADDPVLAGRFHHVVMNLPHEADAFLDVAAWAVRDDGEVHLYLMVDKGAEAKVSAETTAALDASMTRLGRPTGWHLLETRHVRNYAPTIDGLSFTFGGPERGPGTPAAETTLK